jgi:hypothetical protein
MPIRRSPGTRDSSSWIGIPNIPQESVRPSLKSGSSRYDCRHARALGEGGVHRTDGLLRSIIARTRADALRGAVPGGPGIPHVMSPAQRETVFRSGLAQSSLNDETDVPRIGDDPLGGPNTAVVAVDQ